MIRQKKQEYLIISVLPLLLIFYSTMKISFLDFLVGMKIITLSDGVLLTDNFKIAGTYIHLFDKCINNYTNKYRTFIQIRYENKRISYFRNIFNVRIFSDWKKFD